MSSVSLPSSIGEARNFVSKGEYSLDDLVKVYLKRIEDSSDLNIFLETYPESALETAERVNQKILDGNAGKLAGLVLGIKDNIAYKNHGLGAASKILEGFESTYSATVIERLLLEDAVIIGRLNCDEFAMGSSNENSAYGPVKNPLDPTKVPGGSSGGSAAAVAADLCLATLGSDTGGSIRQPASFCGTFGLKPSYGRVSRYGLIAYASSMDQIGPITKSAEDAALLMEVMAGPDHQDSTCSRQTVHPYSKEMTERPKYELAYYSSCVNSDKLDPAVRESFLGLVDALRSDGHKVDEIDFPYLDYLVPTYNVLSNAEASSNLSRFDGMRYGYRSQEASGVDSTYVKSRSEGFGAEVKRRIMLGAFVLSAGFYDAYYSKAQKVRRKIQEYSMNSLSEYDLIIGPTTPHAAFELGGIKDPIAMYLEDIFTVQANLAGLPAVSIPALSDEKGMPVGLQAMANKFEESKLLAFSSMIEEL